MDVNVADVLGSLSGFFVSTRFDLYKKTIAALETPRLANEHAETVVLYAREGAEDTEDENRDRGDDFFSDWVLDETEWIQGLTVTQRKAVREGIVGKWNTMLLNLSDRGSEPLDPSTMRRVGMFRVLWSAFLAWIKSDARAAVDEDKLTSISDELIEYGLTLSMIEDAIEESTEKPVSDQLMNILDRGDDSARVAMRVFGVFMAEDPLFNTVILHPIPTREDLWMSMVRAGNREGVEAVKDVELFKSGDCDITVEDLLGCTGDSIELYLTRRAMGIEDCEYLLDHGRRSNARPVLQDLLEKLRAGEKAAADLKRKRGEESLSTTVSASGSDDEDEDEGPVTKRAKPLAPIVLV